MRPAGHPGILLKVGEVGTRVGISSDTTSRHAIRPSSPAAERGPRPRCAKRTSLIGKLNRGGLGRLLRRRKGNYFANPALGFSNKCHPSPALPAIYPNGGEGVESAPPFAAGDVKTGPCLTTLIAPCTFNPDFAALTHASKPNQPNDSERK